MVGGGGGQAILGAVETASDLTRGGFISTAADSGDSVGDHTGVLGAGEPEVEAEVANGEPLVVEAEQAQHGGVEVADGGRGDHAALAEPCPVWSLNRTLYECLLC